MEEDSHNAYTHVSCNQLRSQFQMMIYLKVATQKSTSILGVCHSIQYNFIPISAKGTLTKISRWRIDTPLYCAPGTTNSTSVNTHYLAGPYLCAFCTATGHKLSSYIRASSFAHRLKLSTCPRFSTQYHGAIWAISKFRAAIS